MSTEYSLELEKIILLSTYRHLQDGKRNLTSCSLLPVAKSFYGLDLLSGQK